jgi:thioredoxin domain-containing protein 5
VTPIKDEDLEKELRDHEVSFVFVQTTQDAALLVGVFFPHPAQPTLTTLQNSLTIAAQSLLGEAPVFTSSSSALLERFSVAPSSAPAILVFKDRDPRSPALTYTVPTTSSQTTLQTWLEAHKLPSALELLPDTFQSVMNAPHEPLVVLVAVPKAGEPGNMGAVDQVRELGRQWRERAASYPGRQVVFTWMDADRWGSWMKSQYGITASMIPAVVLVHHKVCQLVSTPARR